MILLAACDGGPEPGGPDSAVELPDDTGTTETAPTDTASPACDPADLDCDGHLPSEAGGDDCDDLDATTWPGAEEWCDAKDHDCDGEPLAAGVCGKAQAMGGGIGVTVTSVSHCWIVADVTGDDRDDVMNSVGYVYDDEGELAPGVTAVHSGARLGALPQTLPLGAAHAWEEDGDAWDTSVTMLDAGDIDGDGSGDVLIVNQSHPTEIHLHLGPVPDDGEVGGIASDADDTWIAAGPAGQEGATADLDLDGRSDLVLALTEYALLVVTEGGASGSGHVTGPPTEFLDPASDLDGDGVQDFVVNGSQWLSGADLLLSGDSTDAAFTSLYSTDEMWAPSYRRSIDAGDLTGDGVPEIAVADWSTLDDGTGEMYFYEGTLRGELPATSWSGSLHYAEHKDRFSMACALDYDGDGTREYVVYSGEWNGEVTGSVILQAPTSMPGPHDPFPTRGLAFDMAPEDCGPDATGDGLDDLAYLHIDGSGIVPGFAIPWDEDEYW